MSSRTDSPIRHSFNHQSRINDRITSKPLTFSRFGAIASNSSMKRIAGEFFSHSSNALRKLDSDSPASLLIISGPAERQDCTIACIADCMCILQSRFGLRVILELEDLLKHGVSDNTRKTSSTITPFNHPVQQSTQSVPLSRKKNAPVSFATARAISVFPVPGGP